MRKILLAAGLLCGLLATAQAQQVQMKTNLNDPVTGLEAETWATMARKIIDAKSIVGKPLVYMVNATSDELTVNCDRWELVGSKPYIKGNPNLLRPFSVTLVAVDGFDGYCKNGVVAQTVTGELYQGSLNAPDQSFSNSTFITFSSRTKR
jgi:hypothetical protein